MSVQPISSFLASRGVAPGAESVTSDLQQVIAKVTAILAYRRWLFVIPLLTGIGLSLAVSLMLPRRYELNTIFERRDDVVLTKLISSNSPYSFETIRRSLGLDLMGYQALAQAVDDLELTADYPRDAEGNLTPEGQLRKQQLVSSLPASLDVRILEKSTFLDLIQVRYSGSEPELGQRLVARLTENYITRTRAWITDILHKSKDFFAQEADKRRERATALDAKLMQLAAAHPGVNPADPDLLSQRLMSINLAIEDFQLRRAEAESKVNSLKEYLAELDQGHAARLPTTQPASGQASGDRRWRSNPQRERLSAAIDQVKAQIADAKALKQMTDMHPHVMGLREKLEQLRLELEREPAQLSEPVVAVSVPVAAEGFDPIAEDRRRANAELKSLSEGIARIDQNLAKYQVQKQQLEEDKGLLFERRQNYLALQQEAQSAKADWKVWSDHVEMVSRVLAAEEGRRGVGFTTVEKARVPSRPASPTLAGVFLLSAGVGLALGAMAVFLREVFDRSLRDPAKVRMALGIPVLETIGEIRTGLKQVWWSRRLLMPAVAGAETLVVMALGALVYMNLRYPEMYRNVIDQALPERVAAGFLGA